MSCLPETINVIAIIYIAQNFTYISKELSKRNVIPFGELVFFFCVPGTFGDSPFLCLADFGDSFFWVHVA
jgi:hypothetical protein